MDVMDKVVTRRAIKKNGNGNGHTEEKKNDHVFIQTAEKGSTFSGVYYLESVYEKVARNGNKYSDITLRDKSGSRFVRFWGVLEEIKKGDFVLISANVQEYLGNPQIVAQKIEKAETPQDLTLYVPTSSTVDDDKEALKKFKSMVSSICNEIKDVTCSKILDEVFSDSFVDQFIKSPCSILPHYGVSGGLLAHTIRTTSLAFDIAKPYGLDSKEMAILITAGLLHKAGAVDTFVMENCAPVETSKGILVGTDFVTGFKISSASNKLSYFGKDGDEKFLINNDTVLRLLHAVVSCNESYIKPMTKEALVLAKAYQADTTVVEAIDFIAQDDNSNEEFTAYDPLLKRRYYRS